MSNCPQGVSDNPDRSFVRELLAYGRLAEQEFRKILKFQEEMAAKYEWFDHRHTWYDVESHVGDAVGVWFNGAGEVVVNIEVHGYEWSSTKEIPARVGFADEIISEIQATIDAKLIKLANREAKMAEELEKQEREVYYKLKAKFGD